MPQYPTGLPVPQELLLLCYICFLVVSVHVSGLCSKKTFITSTNSTSRTKIPKNNITTRLQKNVLYSVYHTYFVLRSIGISIVQHRGPYLSKYVHGYRYCFLYIFLWFSWLHHERLDCISRLVLQLYF